MAKARKTEIDIDSINIEQSIEKEPEEVIEEELPEEIPKKKKITLITLLIILTGIIILFFFSFGLIFSFWYSKPPKIKKKEVVAEVKTGYYYPLGMFFIPLENNNKKEILFLKLSIEVWTNDQGIIDEIKEKILFFRKELYSFLKKKTIEELEGKEKRELLLKDIKLKLNRLLKKGSVDKVLFTEFFVM